MPAITSLFEVVPMVLIAEEERSMTDRQLRILVTGAGRGIGKSVVEKLKSSPAEHKIALTARTESELVESIKGARGEYLIIPADLTDAGAPAKVLLEVVKKWGGVDVLILNAGDGQGASIESTTDEIWDKTIALNASAPFRFIRSAIPDMKKNNFGRIIVVASAAGLGGAPNISAYSSSKHAVLGLVRSVASELSKFDITVNAVCPTYVDTALTDRTISASTARSGKSDSEARALLASKQPGGRILSAGEVAAAVLEYIDSNQSGETQLLDGTQQNNRKGRD